MFAERHTVGRFGVELPSEEGTHNREMGVTAKGLINLVTPVSNMLSTFDPYQFAGRRPKKSFASEASQIGFAITKDGYADGAHYFKAVGRSSRWIPPFANNGGQLQAVLAEAAVRYAFQSKQVPADLKRTLTNLKQLADDKTEYVKSICDGRSNDYWNKVSATVKTYQDAGGYLDTICAVAYRGWKLRWHNPEIEEHMCLRKDMARDILVRLMRIATEMGFEVYQKRKGPGRREGRPSIPEDKIVAMWKEGASVGKIAAAFETNPLQVRHVIRKLGLYTWRRSPLRGHRTECPKCGNKELIARRRKDGTVKQMECRPCVRARYHRRQQKKLVRSMRCAL